MISHPKKDSLKTQIISLIFSISLLAFLTLISLLSSCSPIKSIVSPWDILRSTPQKQLKLRVVPSDCGVKLPYHTTHGFEMWYMDVFCSDGRIIMIYFKTGSLYKGLKKNAEVSVHIYKEGSQPVIRSFYTSDFHASKEKCNISIGSNTISGLYPDYQLFCNIDDIELSLNINGQINGYKLTDNKVHFGSGSKSLFNEWIVLLPRGYGKGSLKIGNSNKEISGDVYFDHWLGNAPLNETYAQCHWGKVYNSNYSFIFLLANAEKAYGSKPLGFFQLFDQKSLIAATDKISLEYITSKYSYVTAHDYPTRFTISVKDKAIHGSIYCSNCKLLAQQNHVKTKLGKSAKLLSPIAYLLFGKPFSYGMLSKARANFNIKGKKITFKGIMFHEIDNKR